jgi:hypothetical protein
MPLHVFLSQSLSLVTGGLSGWKLAKDVIICLGAVGLLAFVYLRSKACKELHLIVLAVLVYALLHGFLYILMRRTELDVALLASVYNLRPFLLLIIGFCTAALIPKYISPSYLFRFVILVSTVIAALGIIQYFLPVDFLSHLGYTETRGAKPNFLIDNKADLMRVMSTLREPNSFGAFLVVPILILTRKFLRSKNKMLFGGLLLIHGLALLLTFSRSAWLTVVISEMVLLALLYKDKLKPLISRYWYIGALGLCVMVAGVVMLRDQYFVQNVVFHGDENSIGAGSSEKHLDSLESGTGAIVNHPIGHGPGTAGPVSMHTDVPFITENYYLQIGYELGIMGLIVFITLCAFVTLLLIRIPTWQAKVLLASFAGYAVCNLFLHTWSNEAVATQWWLLAGVVIGIKYAHKNIKSIF